MYDRLQRLSYGFFDESQTGQLISRATVDIEAIKMFVGFALLRGVYFMILLLVIIVLLLLLDWKLALISLAVIPFISYRTVDVNLKLRTLWANVQQGLGKLGTIVQENLSGAKIVRAFARENYETRKFREQAETLYNQEVRINDLFAANSPVMSFALVISMAAVLWYGGRQVISGALSQGELAQFLLYLVLLNMPVRMLGWLVMLLSRAVASGRRVYEIIDRISPVKDSPDAEDIDCLAGKVVFEHVHFGYDTQQKILDDITFEVEAGQVIALVGASGSGKTTIASLLPRFYDITSGRILLDGIDIKKIRLTSLRKNIGIVHQDTFLFSASIAENISYGKPGASREMIIEAARTAYLHDFISGLPEGYDTLVGERGITLSGGQKQRLSIARALLLNPRILILDDSTSSVDSNTEFAIQQTLTKALAGRTTFVIAHRLRSVQRADMILVLQNGKIIERGKHEDLLKKNGLYKQLYGLQSQQGADATCRDQSDYLAEQPVPEETIRLDQGEKGTDVTELQHSGDLAFSDEVVYGSPYDSRVVKRLLDYFKAQKGAVILTIAATLLFTLSSVAGPYLVGIAENDYIISGNPGGLNIVVGIFVGMGLLNWFSYALQIRTEARLGQSVLLKLRSQLFEHLQHLPVRFFSRNTIGRIMSRVQNDTNELNEFLESGAFWVIGELVTMLGIVVVLFTMDFRLALIILFVIPLLVLFIRFWQTKARHAFIKVRQAISTLNGALEENISGMRVIQSLSREDFNNREFEKLNRANFQANIRSASVSAAMMPAVEMLLSLGTATLIMFGGIGVLNGTLLIGTLLAFILYIQNFFDPIRNLTMEYTQLQIAMASGSRIFELLDTRSEMQNKTDNTVQSPLKGLIQFDHVSFSYEAGVEVLHDINIKIEPGKTVALVGPTGAGKSTMISLIARFYDPGSGRVLVDGHDLRDLSIQSYRSQLGLVLQDPFLFSGTILENIRYGNLDASDEKIRQAASAAGADDFIMNLPKQYETELEERGQNLSMGQRQLISFARALAADPAILLLDEATASIDSYSENILQQGLNRIRKGRTTVIIAHRLSTIRSADSILVIDNGRITEQGNHVELLSRGGLYSRLYRMVCVPVS